MACLPTESKQNNSVLPLFTCRLISPVANYSIRTDAQTVPCILRKKNSETREKTLEYTSVK